jgi:cobalt-zinc-cadmium efflux system membrane fusion protein
MTVRFRRVAALVLAVLVVAALSGAGVWYGPQWARQLLAQKADPAAAADASEGLQLVARTEETVQLPADVVRTLQIQTAVAVRSTAPRSLELSGTLALDPNRLSHVHARFPGEVVEVGKVAGTHEPIAFGRPVRRGQVLAVIWSQDLGEKKSELIDALSQQRVDEETLGRLARPAAEGAIPDRTMSDAQRKVEADRVAVARALRTLETWRVPKADIDLLRQEANRLSAAGGPSRDGRVQQWAKLELVSPLDGIVVQSNVVLGDLVDTSTDLFQIADLSRLQVIAHAYEEDLPALDDVPPGQHPWTIEVGGGPEAIRRQGKFDQVGCIIDPNQHTALVMGWVDNANGRLRVGQFITATLQLPPAKHEVSIPATALLEEAEKQFIFVQPDAKSLQFVRRRIAVTRRFADHVLVRSRLTPELVTLGVEPLLEGERVVTTRVVQLSAGLVNLKASAALDR